MISPCDFLYCRRDIQAGKNLMSKWISALCTGLLCVVAGYVAYDYYRAGLHNRPEMPEGAFSMSYENGMRAILVNVPDERATRRYFGRPAEVPFYLQDAWAFCNPLTEGEIRQIEVYHERLPGERFEALCAIDVDGEIVVRGLITSVPRL
jgi:hypothetical protein